MKTVGSILAQFLRTTGLEKNVHRYQALQEWPSVVGERISSVTKAEKIIDGKIFVKVTSDTWRNELIYHKHEIVKKLNQKMGYQVIKDIVLF